MHVHGKENNIKLKKRWTLKGIKMITKGYVS